MGQTDAGGPDVGTAGAARQAGTVVDKGCHWMVGGGRGEWREMEVVGALLGKGSEESRTVDCSDQSDV